MSLKNLCKFSKLRKAAFIILVGMAISTVFYYFVYVNTWNKLVTKMKRTSMVSTSKALSHWFNSTVEQTKAVQTMVNVISFNASNERNAILFSEAVSKHQCVRLATPGEPSKICVHPIKTDIYVSGSLIKYGSWEGNLVKMVAKSLNEHPSMMLLDLGCNVGTFTIYMASLKRKVVAVDADKENIQLLSRSLALNHFEDRVVMVWNAISDVHENVILGGYPENRGGTYVKSSSKTDSTVIVKTTTLDDLITMLKNESVYIKMDLETYEWKALNGGQRFFKTINVGYVLMEFSSHRKVDSGKKICDFMSGFGFRPYGADSKINQLLNVTHYMTWPTNVLWSKY